MHSKEIINAPELYNFFSTVRLNTHDMDSSGLWHNFWASLDGTPSFEKTTLFALLHDTKKSLLPPNFKMTLPSSSHKILSPPYY